MDASGNAGDSPTRRRKSTAPPLTVPCPLCHHVFDCPFSQQPRDECLDLWPLGRPSSREIPNRNAPEVREKLALVASHPELQPLFEAWERGEALSDAQYLRLRDTATVQYGDRNQEFAAFWVAMLLIKHVWGPHVKAALEYYPVEQRSGTAIQEAQFRAIRGALVVVDEGAIAADADLGVPVRSHFERLFGDALKYILWGLLRGPLLRLPLGNDEFQEGLESAWRATLRFGNGLFGLSVIPAISVTDLVRYQELGGRDKVVSRGIAEHFMLMLSTFPPLVQMVAPQFGDLAFRRRLSVMFAPMVKGYAWRALRREKMLGDEADARREHLRGEFEAVLRNAIESYDFTYGKTVGPEGVAGALGLSADPEMREHVEAALEHLELPQTVRDITPVEITHHIKARMEARLREAHPVPAREQQFGQSLDEERQASPTEREALEDDEALDVDAEDEDGDLGPEYEAADDDRDWLGETAAPVVIACEADGVRYLYIDEMARRCGVSSDQLRRWDYTGDLPAQRLGDVDPASGDAGTAHWRAYPETEEMISRIRALASAKKRRRAGKAGDEFCRAEAARVLGISAKTLKRWEQSGVAQPIWRDGRPIYTADEIRRLAPISPRNKD